MKIANAGILNYKIMKKKHLLILPLFALFFVFLFTGCEGHYGTYAHASRYQAGDGSAMAQTIANLDVEWVSGEVNIAYGDVAAITFTEESDTDLSVNDDLKMRWYVDMGTLNIHFAKSGTNLPNLLNKTLNITVPTSVTLAEIDVETVSANVYSSVNATKCDFETVSGEIGVKDCTVTNEIDFKTVSGNVGYATTTLPVEIDADTVSGNLSFIFPANASFRVEFDSVSGRMNATDFTGMQNGKFFTVNGGATLVDAETVSGILNIASAK